MKKNYLYQLYCYLIFTFLLCSTINAQSAGDIAFTAFNADGNDDFALVMLADLPANTTLYITDNESDGAGGITSGEGTLTWLTGSSVIKAGTVVIFTDVDNGSNTNFGVSIGSLNETGSFNLSPSSKDGILVFLGSDESTPTSFIAALQIGNDPATLGPFEGDGITLSNTGLVIGASIIVIDSSASPDGATYNSSRSNQISYSNYYSLLSDDSNWTNIVNGDGETLLPFSTEAFTTNTTNWTGNLNTTWSLAGNWDNGIPTSSSLVTIPDVTNPPTIESSAEVGNLIINSGETLTINSANSLTVSGDLSNSGTLTANSGSSLIVLGTSTGNITYNRTLSTTNWYLLSSSVVGQGEDDFASASGLAVGSGNNLALSTAYNTVDDTWTYYQNGASSANTLTSGVGYAVKLASAGDVSFTGTMLTTDLTPINLTTTGNGFNFVGNPYPSYINSATMLTTSTASLLTQTLWIWDQSLNGGTGGYTTKVTVDNFQLAPGQGFFVQSDGAAGTLAINEAFQSHQGTDTFLRSTSRPEVHLNLTDGTNEMLAKIYYIDGTTTGFDNGFDGPMFGGVANEFAIYTHAVANGNGKNLAVQSIPDNDYENMVVPVGINAASGTEITITAEALNLPAGMDVYLEDKDNSSFTRINQTNDKYTTTLSTDLNGVGRFFLHTSSNSLSNGDDLPLSNNLSIYTSDRNNLRIVGVQQGEATVRLYNILGKQVLRDSFTANGANDVAIPNLRTGVYIVQLETENGTLNRKVIIK